MAGGPVIDGVQQMVVAINKLANLESFIRQANDLKQKTVSPNMLLTDSSSSNKMFSFD